MATSTGKFTDGVWGPKHYILAAIAVTLALSAVAVVTSVILSPARIVFSVTATSTNQLQGAPVLILNFTVDAANPSRRAGVEYSSLTARLRVYSASHGAAASVQTVVHQAMPLFQPPASSSSFRASAFFDLRFLVSNSGGNKGGRARRAPPMSVLVRAQVRFKVGLAYSRPYDVEVSCQPVDFFTAAAAGTRIGCVA
ncbi:unnamed protein product [Triticum turgidum subsp. durum]|uniref:Late embryogenesis abundant protein LEA-2 subgroup domain-containing protein n=1 Tax=Triticum turgidum subsp. durum TaxID=4567 RepID=A0A9R1BXY0_TRITD|nr:unnamed protein product [Triticum turgidum subsp. durum]